VSNTHHIRILVTNPETLTYLRSLMERRSAGVKQLKAFSESIGATRCRFGFEDRPFSFDGFTGKPDATLWKKHQSGGYALRKHVKKDLTTRRDELQAQMLAIQVPGPRILTRELSGDVFVRVDGNCAYLLTVDCFGGTDGAKFVISYPAQDRSEPVPEKALAWGEVIKESEYHALREANEAAVTDGGAR